MPPWVDRCRELFARADVATRELATRTGLACPPGCGACCLSPDVETTVAELRPLAAALVDGRRAAAVLARLSELAAAGERRCALYEPSAGDPARGRCTAYGERPLVCRLFGFAGRRDRQGTPELVLCRVLRETLPAARARTEVRDGEGAPLFGDYARAVGAERPGDGVRHLPINDALRLALESELLLRRLAGEERSASSLPPGAGSSDDRGPSRPPRAA